MLVAAYTFWDYLECIVFLFYLKSQGSPTRVRNSIKFYRTKKGCLSIFLIKPQEKSGWNFPSSERQQTTFFLGGHLISESTAIFFQTLDFEQKGPFMSLIYMIYTSDYIIANLRNLVLSTFRNPFSFYRQLGNAQEKTF